LKFGWAQVIIGKVEGTGSWNDFATVEPGSISIERNDGFTVVIKGTHKPKEGVMNLRSLTLTPTDPAPVKVE
jgi:hypothetical protein